ncbi:MAG TPA: glycogen debranching protein, partial [Chitinophagaceae bacterium]|nr:glycogen debranching protein [Chitinophagaceae bacterium]
SSNSTIRTVEITGATRFEKIDLTSYFNDKVTNIFKHEYLSPRPTSPTLQLPTQGIGNWAYPLVTADIDDSGLRKLAGPGNSVKYSEYISFATPSDGTLNNITFTSQWDNFPRSVTVPLSGKASQVYLLMAGSTNPMQSRIANGRVTVKYTDGAADTLDLVNPDNWWPIEQDYYIDGFAFTAGYEIPDRLYLKEGKFGKQAASYTAIRGFTNRAIDGGAATVLDIVLNKTKTLKSLTVETIANDVIVGLMALTLVREQ